MFAAKHLALHGCRSAYPSEAEAQKAAKIIERPDGGDIESFDPNEVMAKAYMTKKPETEEKKKETPEPPRQEGPLAFLGLQKTSAKEETKAEEKTKKETSGVSFLF